MNAALESIEHTMHLYINGMPHLAYLGKTEKGGEFAVKIVPKGWVQTPTSPCHTLCTTGRYGMIICKAYVGGWYAGLRPRYGGLFH